MSFLVSSACSLFFSHPMRMPFARRFLRSRPRGVGVPRSRRRHLTRHLIRSVLRAVPLPALVRALSFLKRRG